MRWCVAKGSRRITLLLPQLKIAIKFPRLQIRYLRDYWMGDVVWMWREMHASEHPDSRKLYWETVRLGAGRALWQTFGGIADNWRERRFYKQCDPVYRELLQPTKFSLFGLFAIQKLGIPCTDFSVCELLCKTIWPDAPSDGHHWDSPGNFDVSSGILKILDYGSVATQKILEKHRYALLRLTFP